MWIANTPCLNYINLLEGTESVIYGKLKIKRLHPDAKIPKYAKDGDAGMDLTSIDNGILSDDLKQVTYKLGLAFEIPKNHVGLIFPRSSVVKTQLSLANCVGVIDSGYRGEVSVVFDRSRGYERPDYSKGDRIAQMVILELPEIEIEEVDELSDSERGEGGWGSTNN